MSHPYLPLFAFPRMVKDLMRGLLMRDVPDADNLDYDHMVRVPEDWVPDGPRFAEIVWSIPFFADNDRESDSPTHLVLIIKFASEVIDDVGDRLDRHAASLHREILRRRAFGAPLMPPLLAPIVIYNGAEPWDAPGGAIVRIRPRP